VSTPQDSEAGRHQERLTPGPPPAPPEEPATTDLGPITTSEPAGGDRAPSLGRTRLSGAWTGLAVALIILVLLLIFLLLNLQKVELNFYGAHVNAPLAVALLFAVVLGALLVFGVGAARILQVRMRARRSR